MEIKDEINNDVEKNKKVSNDKAVKKTVTEKGPLMVVCPLYVKYDR